MSFTQTCDGTTYRFSWMDDSYSAGSDSGPCPGPGKCDAADCPTNNQKEPNVKTNISRTSKYTVTTQGNSFKLTEVEDALHLAKRDAEQHHGAVSVHVDVRTTAENMTSTIMFVVR